MLRVYCDNCIYNRPFDDHQTQEKIFIEAMAFYIVLKWIENGEIESIISDALIYENEKIIDFERKLRIKSYFSLSKYHVELADSIIERAKEIISLGFKSIDALHIAMAESGKADFFITCDDAILKKSRGLHDRLQVKIIGILEFLSEVIYAKNIEGN
jgi:predicted nucleic acid-binding protein